MRRGSRLRRPGSGWPASPSSAGTPNGPPSTPRVLFPLPGPGVVRGRRRAADELPDRRLRPGPSRAAGQAGETILVQGAAGGIGVATIQLAKVMGARVIAVVSTEEKGEVARKAGADDVVLADGFLAQVKELTGGRGVDLVMDPVGGDRFTDSLRCAGARGAAAGRRLHRRHHPRGEGQPAAAQQHQRRRRRLGRVLDARPVVPAGAVGPAAARTSRTAASTRWSATATRWRRRPTRCSSSTSAAPWRRSSSP